MLTVNKVYLKGSLYVKLFLSITFYVSGQKFFGIFKNSVFNNKLSFSKKLSLFPIFFMTAFFYRKPLIFSKLSDISNFC